VRKILFPVLCFLALSVSLLGRVQEREFLALKTDELIQIDGLLNEPIWENAPDAGVYIQPPPNRKDPQKITTIVKILFNDTFLYIGFLCLDTEPENITSAEIGKDGDLRATDSIYILIDAFKEYNFFYYFATNVEGIRSDGLIPKGGRSVDYRWNGSWDSASRRTDSGWSAEVAIERSGLFVEPTESKTLGLSLTRVVPRLEYSIFLPNPLDAAFRTSDLRELQVVELLTAEEQLELEEGTAPMLETDKRLVIVPYGISELEAGEKIIPSGGLDVHYSFSERMSGWLTSYPDFTTVEPDHEQVNLTPFELYLPERRDFFRGTSVVLQSPFGLFYSKRIGDIYGGVKLSGQSETYEFFLLSAQTIKEKDLDLDSANYTVLSFKRANRMNSFFYGVTAANQLIGGRSKGSAGIEARLDLTDKLKFSGQLALSYGDKGKKNTAFFIGPSYDSVTFHIHLHYKQIGEYFGDNANYVGFIPDDNRRELDSAIYKTFPFRFGFFEQIIYRSNYNIYWGMGGTLRSWQIDEGLFFDIRKTKFIFSLVHTMEYKLNDNYLEPKQIYIPEKGGWVTLHTYDFRNYRTRICSEFYAGEWQQFSLSLTLGKNYGSQFHMFTISKKFEITKNFFSEYNLYRIQYQTKSLYNSTFIHVFRLTFYINEFLHLRGFFQSNSDIGKANFHVVAAYTFKPPYGTVQLIYQKGTGMFGEKGIQGHTLFLKIGYMF
jgi:hypothetical protein